eukprot:scaffold698_cov397-Pinguiococcus_pyrenoidosus.AAC.2
MLGASVSQRVLLRRGRLVPRLRGGRVHLGGAPRGQVGGAAAHRHVRHRAGGLDRRHGQERSAASAAHGCAGALPSRAEGLLQRLLDSHRRRLQTLSHEEMRWDCSRGRGGGSERGSEWCIEIVNLVVAVVAFCCCFLLLFLFV